MTRYQDRHRNILEVGRIGEGWGTVIKDGEVSFQVKSRWLPVRILGDDAREKAQEDLDGYANLHHFARVIE